MLRYIGMSSARLRSSLLATALLLSACAHRGDDSPLVASVYGHELHRSDLAGLVPAGMLPEDSALVVSNYVDQWIRQTVLLDKAEKNVEADFSRELQEYRNNLLVYAYERQIVDQLLDTVVTSAQIFDYYQAHRSDFRLKSSIVKAVYVKVPRNAHTLQKIKSIISRPAFSERDVVELEETASRHKLSGYYDATAWIPFYVLQSAVPITTYNEQLFLRQNRIVNIADDSLAYCTRILDYKVTEEESPLEFQRDNIRAIILNHRKIEILDRLHSDLLVEAERSGHVKKNI